MYDDTASLKVYEHIVELAQELYQGLSSLKHFNRQALCETYPDYSSFSPSPDPFKQEAIVAFNILQGNGAYLDYVDVLQQTSDWKTSIRITCASVLVEAGEIPYEAATLTATIGAGSASQDVDDFLACLLEAFIERPDLEVVVSQIEVKHHLGSDAERFMSSPLSPTRSPTGQERMDSMFGGDQRPASN